MEHHLTSEEEKEYATKILAGDEFALEEFVEINLPLVSYVLSAFTVYDKPMKDVIKSEATLVLNKIAKDPNKWRGKFSTFAVACMRNRVIDCLRKKRIRFESTDNEEWFTEDEKLPKHSFDFKEEIDSFDISTLNFGVLSDFEREVIFLRCNDGISFDDIASLLGSYKMKIHRTYKEACLKLRLLTSDNNS